MTRTSRSSTALHAARVADEQLSLALAAIHQARTQGCGCVPDARRHIRRVKALMRIVDPLVEDHLAAEVEARLRVINRQLADVADGAAAIRTLAHLGARYGTGPDGPAIAAVREALVQRADRNDAAAAVTRLLQRSETALAVERARIGTWRQKEPPPPVDFERGIRRAANDLTIAVTQPVRRHHRWRRCSTMMWVHLRMVEGGRHHLRSMVDAMDASLEESRTVTVLGRLLRSEALASRADRAAVLRLLRQYQRELRGRATTRAREVLAGITRHDVDPQGGRHRHAANVHHRPGGRSRSGSARLVAAAAA